METLIVIVIILVAVAFLLLKLRNRVKNPYDCDCTSKCSGCEFNEKCDTEKENYEQIQK